MLIILVNEGKHEKKSCKDATGALEALVTKCSNQLQLPALAAVAVANCDKEIIGVKVIFEETYVKEKLLETMKKKHLD